MIGTLLKDTYRVVEPLGEGGMGTIYVAEHKTLPKRYAVKVLKAAEQASAELLARFEREARIASGLGHPNIVEVLDFDLQADGSPFFVMELLEGEDLAQRLARGGPMEPTTLLPIARQLCAALAAAHHAGIVHRDLKPPNVYLHRWGDEELVKVLDFGISKMAGGQTDLTADSAVIGTAHYMAPEQARGSAADVDGRADLFSLGAILFECLTGKRAFDGGTLPEIIHALCYGERPTLAPHRPELAEALDPVLARLLSVEREARFDTAQQTWNELAPALGKEASTLPLGKHTPDGESGLEATLAADTPDPALDATVASDASPPPGSVVATRAESPEALGDGQRSQADATAAKRPPPKPGIRGRTLALLGVLLGGMVVALGIIAVRSCTATKDKPPSTQAKPTATSTPRPRPAPRKRVTLALLPGRCEGKPTDIAEALRESTLRETAVLLLPPDEVDRALRELTGSRDGVERQAGHRLDASLLISQRCVDKQVKVRLVRVSDGRVLKTKLVDQPVSPDQLLDLVSLITFESVLLVADLEAGNAKAAKAFKTFWRLISGGMHRGNYARVRASLEEAHRTDPKWHRPRIALAGLLVEEFKRTGKPQLLQRAEQMCAPLDKPGGKFRGHAVILMGVVALFRGDISLSLKYMSRAATLMPSDPTTYAVRSQIYQLQGEDRLAREVLLKGIAASPSDPKNQRLLVSLQWLAGEFEKALETLAPALAQQDRQRRLGATDPDLRLGARRSEGAHTTRGLILLSLGRMEPAIGELRIELKQLSGGTSFANAFVEATTYFLLAVIHRAKGAQKKQKRFRRRAERALRKHLATTGIANLDLINLIWLLAPLAPDWVGPLLDRFEQPKKPFFADLQVARAGAQARLGNSRNARIVLAKAVALAPKERRKGLRQVHRRFLQVCRKMDIHWKKQRLKLPPPAQPIQRHKRGKPGMRRRPGKPPKPH